MGNAATVKAAEITAKLKAADIPAEYDLVGRSLKAQMKYADKVGAHYTLILGDSEMESGKAQLKDMTNSTQEEVEIDTLVQKIALLK